MGNDSFRKAWRESWERVERNRVEQEEKYARKHAAAQDRLRGGATAIEIRETFKRAAGRIVRRTPPAIALGIGAVYLGRIGFDGIRDYGGDLGALPSGRASPRCAAVSWPGPLAWAWPQAW